MRQPVWAMACAILLALPAIAIADEPEIDVRLSGELAEQRVEIVPAAMHQITITSLGEMTVTTTAAGAGSGGFGFTPQGTCPPQVTGLSPDSTFQGGSYLVQQGFAQGEIAGASFVVPPEIEMPIRLRQTELIFAQDSLVQTTTQWTLLIWQGLPSTGQPIGTFSSDNVILPHIVLPPGVQGVNMAVQVDPEDPEQIIIEDNGSRNFSIGYRIDIHNSNISACVPNPFACAFPVCDTNGLNFPVRNWLFAIQCAGACPSGWHRFSEIASNCRPSGDWAIRVTYEPVFCTLPPEIQNVNPPTAPNNLANPVTLTVTGANFLPGGTAVRLLKSGEFPIVGQNVNVNSQGTSLTAKFNITGAMVGAWDVEVTVAADSDVLVGGFAVTPPPAPAITDFDPALAVNSGEFIATINGERFVPGGTTVDISMGTSSVIAGTDISVASATELTATFDATGAATGFYDCTVTTSTGSDTLVAAVQVIPPPPPVVNDFSPAMATNLTSINATVLGNFFEPGMTSVDISMGTAVTIAATNVMVLSPMMLTCDFDLSGTSLGTYACAVTTPFGTTALQSALEIVEPGDPPTVFAADPGTASSCPGTEPFTIFGLDFVNGATVKMVRSGFPDVPAMSVTFNDSTNLTATFNMGGVAVGDWDFRVTNPDSQFADTPTGLGVAVSACTPTLNSVLPNNSNNHQSNVGLTLSGQNFLNGATVRLTRTGQPNINATSVVVSGNNQQITCNINPFLKQVGSWNVIVENPGGTTATLTNGFNVTAGPAPTVTVVVTSNPTNCGVYHATILGSNFLTNAGARLTLGSESDIVATNVVRVSASQLTADFDLTGVAVTPTSDKWDCIVTNPDGQTGTRVNAVNVTACPVMCNPGDMNADGLVDGDDINAFVRVLIMQTGTSNELCAANMAAPAGVDTADLSAFIDCLVDVNCP